MKNKDIVCKHIGSVIICNQKIDVYLVDFNIVDSEHGHIICPANKIYLSKEQSSEQMLTTLIHECLHKMFEEHQIGKNNLEGAPNAEEKVVEALDSPITQDILLSKTNRKMFNKILKGKLPE